MRGALVLPVSDGYADADAHPRGHLRLRLLSCHHHHPARVEPHLLRGEHDFLSPVPDGLVGFVALRHERHMGVCSSDDAEPRDDVERLGIVCDKLDVKPAFLRASGNDVLQLGRVLLGKPSFFVTAHRVPCSDSVE